MHALAIRAPRICSEPVNASVVHLADVLVANLPCVYTQAMHPPILPLALKLVTARKAMRASTTLQAVFPVALVAGTISVDADTDAMHLAILDMSCVLTFHE